MERKWPRGLLLLLLLQHVAENAILIYFVKVFATGAPMVYSLGDIRERGEGIEGRSLVSVSLYLFLYLFLYRIGRNVNIWWVKGC
uniref:Putative secreted peptide n=1 Tax=Anopheles braziliensis TaxID=58242 RepID=A0A2M3ZQQ7_9DIPT